MKTNIRSEAETNLLRQALCIALHDDQQETRMDAVAALAELDNLPNRIAFGLLQAVTIPRRLRQPA